MPFTRPALQQLMWDAVGVYRDESTLRAALARFESWEADGTTLHDRENANLLQLAKALVDFGEH